MIFSDTAIGAFHCNGMGTPTELLLRAAPCRRTSPPGDATVHKIDALHDYRII